MVNDKKIMYGPDKTGASYLFYITYTGYDLVTALPPMVVGVASCHPWQLGIMPPIDPMPPPTTLCMPAAFFISIFMSKNLAVAIYLYIHICIYTYIYIQQKIGLRKRCGLSSH